MDKTQIIELLKSVKYPGFTRDIVSFGMVNNITVTEEAVTVKLKISTPEKDKAQTILNSVRNILVATEKFQNVNVELLEDTPAEQTSPTGSLKAESSINGDVKHIIAIASGKGGVGKSTVAVNIAAVLTQNGYRVGLLDLDIYGPSLPIILGINKQPRITPNRKLIPIDYHGMKVMSFGFLSGNDTPVIWRGPLVARMTEQFFADVEWGELDYLILDLPPGTGDVQLTLTQKTQLSGAVIITTPQDIALADVRKGADMFRKVQAPVLGVIENMSGLHIEGRISNADGRSLANITINFPGKEPIQPDEEGKFSLQLDLFKQGGGAKESKRLGVPLLGKIPFSQEIMESTDAGNPIVFQKPESSISRIYKDIVDQIEKTL